MSVNKNDDISNNNKDKELVTAKHLDNIDTPDSNNDIDTTNESEENISETESNTEQDTDSRNADEIKEEDTDNDSENSPELDLNKNEENNEHESNENIVSSSVDEEENTDTDNENSPELEVNKNEENVELEGNEEIVSNNEEDKDNTNENIVTNNEEENTDTNSDNSPELNTNKTKDNNEQEASENILSSSEVADEVDTDTNSDNSPELNTTKNEQEIGYEIETGVQDTDEMSDNNSDNNNSDNSFQNSELNNNFDDTEDIDSYLDETVEYKKNMKQQKRAAKKAKKKNKKLFILIALIVLAVLSIIGGIIYYDYYKKNLKEIEFNIEDYYQVNIEGISGSSKLILTDSNDNVISSDEELHKSLLTYAKKLNLDNEQQENRLTDVINSSVLDESNSFNLANGDTGEVTIDFDENLASEKNIKVSDETFSLEVEGLFDSTAQKIVVEQLAQEQVDAYILQNSGYTAFTDVNLLGTNAYQNDDNIFIVTDYIANYEDEGTIISYVAAYDNTGESIIDASAEELCIDYTGINQVSLSSFDQCGDHSLSYKKNYIDPSEGLTQEQLDVLTSHTLDDMDYHDSSNGTSTTVYTDKKVEKTYLVNDTSVTVITSINKTYTSSLIAKPEQKTYYCAESYKDLFYVNNILYFIKTNGSEEEDAKYSTNIVCYEKYDNIDDAVNGIFDSNDVYVDITINNA